MNWKFAIILLIQSLALMGTFTFLYRYFNIQNDNPLEEAIEKVIQDETNIPIDLTPESKEM